MDQVEQLEACTLGGFWFFRSVFGLRDTQGNPRGSVLRDHSVAALLPDIPSRSAEAAADTQLAAPGGSQGGPHERLDWFLLGGGRERGPVYAEARERVRNTISPRLRPKIPFIPTPSLPNTWERTVATNWKTLFSAALSRSSGGVLWAADSTALLRRRLQARTRASAGSALRFRLTRSTADLPASIAAAAEDCGNAWGVLGEPSSSDSGPRLPARLAVT